MEKMKLKESTYEYMKLRTWENMDAFIHLAATGQEPWMYPHFIYKNEYVIDPWMRDPDKNATICNPDKEYGWEKMDWFPVKDYLWGF